MFFSSKVFAPGHRPTQFDKWALANTSYEVRLDKRTLANARYMYEMKYENYVLINK